MSKTATSPSFAHRLYTGDFQIDFMARRKVWYSITAIMLLISALAFGLRGLNLGIEFKGGSVFQVPVQVESRTLATFQSSVARIGIPDLAAQISTVGDQTVRVQTRSLGTEEVTTVRAALANEAGVSEDTIAYSLIGPSWGQQITRQALIALGVFLVLVGLLIWGYFREWQMSLAALLALLHDTILTVGLYALVGFTVTPATVIAVLTILGYSLYDTVVVFDMVREQTRDLRNQSRTYSQAANAAINQVLVRSINTTLIAVLPVLALLIAGVAVLGGEGPLADLGLAMFIGMVSGAYSSIFLATPFLAQLREREPQMIRHRKSLEKSRKRGQAKVTAAVASQAEVTAAGIPLSAIPSSGVLEFAEAEAEGTEPAETTPADESRPKTEPEEKAPTKLLDGQPGAVGSPRRQARRTSRRKRRR